MIILIPFQILPLDQTLNPLFNKLRTGDEPNLKLPRHLGNQIIVMKLLPRLHNPHGGSLDLMTPLFFQLKRQGLIRRSRRGGCAGSAIRPTALFVLGGFLDADEGDFDPSGVALVVGVEGERLIVAGDALSLAPLAEDAVLGGGEGDEVPAKFEVWNVGFRCDLSKRELGSFVE